MQKMEAYLSPTQKQKATEVLKRNLTNYSDWIVLNHTMQTLADWAKENSSLRDWLIPQLEQLRHDARKSVANRATKLYRSLSA